MLVVDDSLRTLLGDVALEEYELPLRTWSISLTSVKCSLRKDPHWLEGCSLGRMEWLGLESWRVADIENKLLKFTLKLKWSLDVQIRLSESRLRDLASHSVRPQPSSSHQPSFNTKHLLPHEPTRIAKSILRYRLSRCGWSSSWYAFEYPLPLQHVWLLQDRQRFSLHTYN